MKKFVITAIIAILAITASTFRLRADDLADVAVAKQITTWLNPGKSSSFALTLNQTDVIIGGLAANQVIQNNDEVVGLKKLWLNVDRKHFYTALSSTPGVHNNFIDLLYRSRQALVPNDLTATSLRTCLVDNCRVIQDAEHSFWSRPEITSDLLASLENFPPEEAAPLVSVIAKTWYIGNGRPTQSAEQVFAVCEAVRTVEFAKLSTLAKLLATEGRITIPSSVDVNIAGNHPRTVHVTLEPVPWTVEDVVGLTRLTHNPYYGESATVLLEWLSSQPQ